LEEGTTTAFETDADPEEVAEPPTTPEAD